MEILERDFDLNEDFEPYHYRALAMLVAGRSIAQISEELGISDRTIQRWKNRPDFKDLLYEGVAKAYESAIAEIVSQALNACKKLNELIDDPSTPAKTRLTAIQIALEYGGRGREYFLGGKLEKIEKLLSGGIHPSVMQYANENGSKVINGGDDEQN